MTIQPPVIVLPGITAATLRDEYKVEPEVVFQMLRKQYDRITLHVDDLRYEEDEPARVVADALFALVYGDLIKELRHNLTPFEDLPTPVFPFTYDWRKPLKEIQAHLGPFIDEVIARTSLLRHYHPAYAKNPQVDLVGHSMGGLIISGYLAETHDQRVRKVATLGTPFRGSFEAVLMVAVGTAALASNSNSRDREAARLTPALYHLIPRFPGAILDHPDPDYLFSAANWQLGVIQTLADHLRRKALDPPADPMVAARALLQRMLDEARAHRDSIDQLTIAPADTIGAGMNANDWLSIVGVGEKTRTELKVTRDASGEPFFDLDGDQRKNGYPKRKTARPDETGDGTVPFQGARTDRKDFLPLEKVVCVCDSDFGYWEVRDRLLEGPVSLHGLLPLMNLVQKLCVAHFKADTNQPGEAHPGIWGRRPPGVTPTAWSPPIRNLNDKS